MVISRSGGSISCTSDVLYLGFVTIIRSRGSLSFILFVLILEAGEYSRKWGDPYPIHCNKNPIYVFPEKELCSSVPISTFMCLWAIYLFPGSVCLFCWRKICGPILGINKSLTDTWMWKLGLRPRMAQFLFWEYLFRIFGIVALHCTYDVLDLGFVTIIGTKGSLFLFYLF